MDQTLLKREQTYVHRLGYCTLVKLAGDPLQEEQDLNVAPCVAFASLGTVFLIDPSQHIGSLRIALTAKHVTNSFQSAAQMQILAHDGKSTFQVRSCWSSSQHDFAVLFLAPETKLAATGFIFPPASRDNMELGSPIHCWGFPRSNDQGAIALLARGYVSWEAGGVNIGGNRHQRFVFNMDVHHGTSGGPVVQDGDSYLSGVVLTKHKDLSAESMAVIQDISNRSSIITLSGSKSLGDDFTSMFQILESTMHLGMGEALPISIVQEELRKALHATLEAVDEFASQGSVSQGSPSTKVSAALTIDVVPDAIVGAIPIS